MRRLLMIFGLCFVSVILGGAFCAAWMIRHGFSARSTPGAVESTLAESMRDLGIPSRYKSLKNPVAATPETLQEGMAHWADHCATCHANDGSGSTMYGNTMYPRPPDMRRKETQNMSDGELYYTIQNGIMLSGMPAFGAPGDNDLDSWKLVAFIRHLRSLAPSEVQEMEKMNPKSPDEMEEEREEDNFLKGGPASAQPTNSNHH